MLFSVQVVLHRLSQWQKVWTLSPPSEGTVVSALAWRPDGKGKFLTFRHPGMLLFHSRCKEVQSVAVNFYAIINSMINIGAVQCTVPNQ